MLNYHLEHHVCEKRPKIKLTIRKALLSENYETMTKKELYEQNLQLKGQVAALKNHPQTVNNVDNVVNVVNNVVTFPTAFGKENMEHVEEKLGDIMRPLIISHPRMSIPKLFTQIHNNKQLPEYHNIYTASERSQYVMVSDGESFKYRPKKTVIDQIIEDKRSLLNQYVDDNGDQLGERVLKKYEKYQDDIDSNSEFRKQLEIEIGGLLLNMKSVIANDEKTCKLLDKVDEGDFELSPSNQTRSNV